MLEIRLLGHPEFRRGGQTLPPLATRKTQSLLAYLIFHRDHPHSRDELATLFWGDRDDVRARRSLTTALWCIRRLLGENYLFADPTLVQFNPASDFWLDVAEFEEQVNKYTSTAVDIYRGDFLEGFYDDWCIEARYHLEAVYLDALTRLVARCEAQRNFTLVLTYTQKYLAHDLLAENVHFTAMRALVALGDVAGAQRQWQFCCEVQQQELHTPPSLEMLEQAQSILGAHFRLPLPVEILQPLTPSRRGSLEQPPFVGRTRELNVLLARWEEAIRGKSGLVLIGGEAGIGKTRLTEEFASTVRWRGAVVAHGRCYEPERVLPYQPIAEVLCDLSQERDVRALPAWVQAELARIVPMLRRSSAHEFGQGRQGAEERSPYTLSEAGARQAVLFHAIVAFVRHFAARTPLLMVLEDLHWASDSTLAGLHYLTRQIANAPVLIVGTFRPEEAGEAHALTMMAGELAREGLAQHLALEHLSADAVAELVRRVRERNSSAEWVSRLYAHTEGNAFFLIETLRALDEAPTLPPFHPPISELRNGGTEGGLPVPGTVRALIQARLSRLSASVRNFVACAAVAGRAFDFDIVCRVPPPFERGEEETALEAIDELLRRGFLREGTGIVGRDYEFVHSLIQQVVYAGLHHRRRQRLHRLTGETLESLYRERREELLGTLAHHFDAAGEEEKALQYHSLTARRAESLFAWQEAEEHQSRMLVLLDRLDPDCKRSDYQVQRGQVLADRAYLRFLQGRLAERDTDLSALDAGCPFGAPTHLQVEIVDIAVNASAERIYCYVSFENAPEVRLPAQDGDFIAVQGGHGSLTLWPHSFAMPIPPDGILDLSGECWGWAGQDLSKMGTFTASLGSETWDGAPRLAHGGAFDVSLSVLAQGGAKMTFAERSPGIPSGSGSFPGFLEDTLPIDPNLPIPVVKWMVVAPNIPLLAKCNPLCRELGWQWDGDQTKIKGFLIFLDDSLFPTLMPFPSQRSMFVQPPISACSSESRWQVAAVTASAISQLSQPYTLPAAPATLSGSCDIYIKVKFEYLDLEWTNDSIGSGGPGDCDTTDAYYYIHADERGTAVRNPWLLYQPRKFYGTGFYRPLKCGIHSFHDLADTVNPALVFDLFRKTPPFSELLLFGELVRPDEPLLIFVGAQFWDYDASSGDDLIVKFGTLYEAPSFQSAINYFGCGRTFVDDDEEEAGKSRTQYTVTVYPNACERTPDFGSTK